MRLDLKYVKCVEFRKRVILTFFLLKILLTFNKPRWLVSVHQLPNFIVTPTKELSCIVTPKKA